MRESIEVGDRVRDRKHPSITGTVLSIDRSFCTAEIIVDSTKYLPAEKWCVCLENWKKI